MLKKFLPAVLFFLQPITAYSAQVVDVLSYVPYRQLSAEFISELENCRPYQEKYNAMLLDKPVHITYEIAGKDEDKCKLTISAGTDESDIGSSLNCLIKTDDMPDFILAWRALLKYGDFADAGLMNMLQDENYRKVMSVWTDEDICTFHREGIDLTKDFRRHLADCSPFTEIQKDGPLEITRSISAPNGDNCQVAVSMSVIKPDFKKLSAEQIDFIENNLSYIPDNLSYQAHCNFSAQDIADYKRVLLKQKISAAENLKAAADGMQKPPLADEFVFLRDKCKLNSEDIKSVENMFIIK